MKRLVWTALFIALLTMGFAAQITGAADYTLNIGYTPGGDQLALYVAKEKGSYERPGMLASVIRLTTAPTGVDGFPAGALELSMTAVLNVLLAVEGGIDLVVVR